MVQCRRQTVVVYFAADTLHLHEIISALSVWSVGVCWRYVHSMLFYFSLSYKTNKA